MYDYIETLEKTTINQGISYAQPNTLKKLESNH